MTELLGITLPEAIAVVIATCGMYAGLVLLVRLLGQRILTATSSFDLAAIITFGSVIGRASLGMAPRLAGGLIALATLVAIQAIAGAFRLTRIGARALNNRPVVLMAGPRIIDRHLSRYHISPAELHSRLRIAGISRLDQVGAVIFEPSGTLSVLRTGEPIDPDLLEDVVGADLLRPTQPGGKT